jgi:hypothetical protein
MNRDLAIPTRIFYESCNIDTDIYLKWIRYSISSTVLVQAGTLREVALCETNVRLPQCGVVASIAQHGSVTELGSKLIVIDRGLLSKLSTTTASVQTTA